MTTALEKHLFTHLRDLLGAARDEFERRHGEDSWPGPDPAKICLEMLAGATLLTDSCNAARCARRLFAEMIGAAVKASYGDRWSALTLADQQAASLTYSMDCHQHLRNIFLSAGSAAASAHLKEALGESLKQFSSFERMSTDANALIRGCYKELHPEGEYAKGHGGEFAFWRKHTFGATPYVRLERAKGGRQVMSRNEL